MFSRKPTLAIRGGILQLARLFKRVTGGARIPFSAMPRGKILEDAHEELARLVEELKLRAKS